MAENKQYDVVIIGAGPGGMTAAMYASRANLSVLMLDRGIYGGNLNNTAEIENYTGFKSVKGPELAQQMYEGATQFGAEYAYGTVTKVELDGDLKKITTDMDETYTAKAVVIATGSDQRHLNVPGEEEFGGRGVSYCAVCDGPFFRDEPVAVIGGGNSALQEADYLTRFASKVHVIVRRNVFRADKIVADKAIDNPKIEVHFLRKPVEVLVEDNKVKGIRIENSETHEQEDLFVNAIFPFIGLDPVTDFAKDLGICNEQGYIVTDENMQTQVPGIYAAGDVRAKFLRQVVTATNDGAIAAQSISHHLNEA